MADQETKGAGGAGFDTRERESDISPSFKKTVGTLVVIWDRGIGIAWAFNRPITDTRLGQVNEKMRGFGENLPRNLLIYCAIFLSVTFLFYRHPM
jgi:hypothetical protein